MKWVDREIQLKQNSSFKCSHCFTGCFQLNYDSSFSTAKIYDRVPFLQKRNLNPKDISIVHIYYGQSTFRAHKKDELVGFTDFLCMEISFIYYYENKIIISSFYLS